MDPIRNRDSRSRKIMNDAWQIDWSFCIFIFLLFFYKAFWSNTVEKSRWQKIKQILLLSHIVFMIFGHALCIFFKTLYLSVFFCHCVAIKLIFLPQNQSMKRNNDSKFLHKSKCKLQNIMFFSKVWIWHTVLLLFPDFNCFYQLLN